MNERVLSPKCSPDNCFVCLFFGSFNYVVYVKPNHTAWAKSIKYCSNWDLAARYTSVKAPLGPWTPNFGTPTHRTLVIRLPTPLKSQLKIYFLSILLSVSFSPPSLEQQPYHGYYWCIQYCFPLNKINNPQWEPINVHPVTTHQYPDQPYTRMQTIWRTWTLPQCQIKQSPWKRSHHQTQVGKGEKKIANL